MVINWTNVTDLSQIPALANVSSNNTFWLGMLFMIWIVLLLLFLVSSFEMALMTASFLAMLLGILLAYADLIAWEWVLLFVGIQIIMFLYVTWSNSRRI